MNYKKKTSFFSAIFFLVSLCSSLSVAANHTGYYDKTANNICITCACMAMSHGYTVDCNQAGFKEIPSFRQDLKVPWIFSAQSNSIKKVTRFPDLKNLTEITLRYNLIEEIAGRAFANLTTLFTLDLSHNKITWKTFDGDAFQGLYNSEAPTPLPLRTLNLSHNLIGKLPEHAFEHLQNITHLDISYNEIFDISQNTANAFTELVSLQYLNMAYTHLNRLPNHFFAELNNLKELDLSGNMFAYIPPEVNYARHLKSLYLDNNLFGMIEGRCFWESLSGLENLYLREIETLFKVEPGAFVNLTSLQKLHLNSNPELEYIVTGAFRTGSDVQSSLQELHINNNKLEVLSEDLIDWYNIALVDMRGNPWNCDCMFEWVATEFAKTLYMKSAGLADGIVCASPPALVGLKVLDEKVQDDNFECHKVEGVLPRSSNIAVATIIIGALLLLTGVLAVGFVACRRMKGQDWIGDNVKYRRTVNQEDEIIATTETY